MYWGTTARYCRLESRQSSGASTPRSHPTAPGVLQGRSVFETKGGVSMNLGVPALVGALFLVSWTAPLTAVAANTAPRISGAPATSVRAFEPYNFRPVARDADRQWLRFAIANKPPWASFDRTTGRLYGTPRSEEH